MTTTTLDRSPAGFRWSLLAVAAFVPLKVRQNDVLTVEVVPGRVVTPAEMEPGRATLSINGADPRPLDLESLSFVGSGDLACGLKTGALVLLTMTEQDYWLGQARCRAARRAGLHLVKGGLV